MSTPADGPAQFGSRHDWVPMSPDRIRSMRLREAGRGRRGYRTDDADALLGRLATEIEQWAQRCASLQTEVQRLRNYYREHGTEVDVGPAGHARMSTEAVQMLARAQAYADQMVAQAQAQARSMQVEARAMAEMITAHARRDAEEAVHSYRASAGASYSPDREETERLAAWARSILATMEATQKQLAAAGQAFALELAKFAPPQERSTRRREPVYPPPGYGDDQLGLGDEPSGYGDDRTEYGDSPTRLG